MLGYTSILKECVHFTYKTQPNVTMGTSLVAQTKESVCNVGELDSIPGLGRSLGWEDPLEGAWQCTPVFLHGESH